jgi:hypothetical protein
MAETIKGSFSFSILDDKNNLYLVNGDSPLSILHFPKQSIYVYASTDNILYKALIDSPLFKDLKKGEFEEISIDEGEILTIASSGELTRSTFDYCYTQCRNWWDYGSYFPSSSFFYEDDDLIDYLKMAASFEGHEPEIVDSLFKEGFTYDEIEEYIYS